MTRRAALYLRVSTVDQNCDNQLRELEEVARRVGYDIVKVYKDHGISGAKGRDKRPGFDDLCKDAARRKFDVIMAWSVDRLGRSLQDLVAFLTETRALKVDLYLHQQGIDTTTPSGKAMFQMMGVFSEFERSMIRERVRAGLARAKADGIQLGRPRLDPEKSVMIRDHLAKGMTLGRVAELVGCGTSTVQRIRAEMIARSTVLASGSRASGFP